MADDGGPILNAFRVKVEIEVDQEDLERQIQEVMSRVTGRFGEGLAEQASSIEVRGQEGRDRSEDDEKPERFAQTVAEAVERSLGGFLERMDAGRIERIETQDLEGEVDFRKMGSMIVDAEQVRVLEDISERLDRVVQLLEEREAQ
jgi:hypothetical protein